METSGIQARACNARARPRRKPGSSQESEWGKKTVEKPKQGRDKPRAHTYVRLVRRGIANTGGKPLCDAQELTLVVVEQRQVRLQTDSKRGDANMADEAGAHPRHYEVKDGGWGAWLDCPAHKW
jgi:hypothetical protein